MRLKKTYSSREVAALTGLTARQLQLWDAGGLLSAAIPSHRTPAGGNTERRYTPNDLFGERLFEATGGGGSVRLLTDGREIYARTSSGEVFNLLRTPTQALLVV